MNFGGGSVKSQFKRAEKSGARFALAMTGSCYEISFLTEARSKESIAPPDLKAWLQAWSVRS
jgi:hypothetical protein